MPPITGLNVAALNDLRRQLKAEQCKYKITKNTLTRLACRKARLEALEPLLEARLRWRIPVPIRWQQPGYF